jgi:hypothetical protein
MTISVGQVGDWADNEKEEEMIIDCGDIRSAAILLLASARRK